MKKKILLFVTIIGIFIVSAIKIHALCMAETTCPGGEVIRCWGASSCSTGPGWVMCDGQRMAECIFQTE